MTPASGFTPPPMPPIVEGVAVCTMPTPDASSCLSSVLSVSTPITAFTAPVSTTAKPSGSV
eukprot:6459772-Amphidinium_carterae.1